MCVVQAARAFAGYTVTAHPWRFRVPSDWPPALDHPRDRDPVTATPCPSPRDSPTEAMSSADDVYMAKLAEQAERYDEIAEQVRHACGLIIPMRWKNFASRRVMLYCRKRSLAGCWRYCIKLGAASR